MYWLCVNFDHPVNATGSLKSGVMLFLIETMLKEGFH